MRFSIEAEQSVIGGLMLKNSAFDDVSQILTVNDFYNADNRAIYQAMIDLAAAGNPLDVVSMAEKLNDAKMLDEVGGLAFLIEIANNTPSSSNIEFYARIVADRSTERQIIAAAYAIQERVIGEGSADDKLDFARSTIGGLDNGIDNEVVPFNDILKGEVTDIDNRFRGNCKAGLMTGFSDLDLRFGGVEETDLWILAARPSMGKTTLALNLCHNVAMTGGEVLIFSLEISKEQMSKKLLSAASGIPYQILRTGQLTEQHWPMLSAGVAKLKDRKFHIIDIAGIDIDRAISIARKFSRKSKLSLIMFDYLQLITAKSESRFDEISYISRRLKVLAKTVKAPVLALSQLSRKCEERANKRPINSDLRESGQIEQDADIITFIYRDEVYNDDSPEKGIAELITSKFRNGECGVDRVAAVLEKSKFDNLSAEYRPREYAEQPKRKTLY